MTAVGRVWKPDGNMEAKRAEHDVRRNAAQPGTKPATARRTVGRDARDEHEIERLTRRVAQLEQEKAAVEAFAGLAAHELIEPLVLTEAYATTIAERLHPELDAESLRDLDLVGRSVRRLRLLVESLLEDARSAEQPLRRTPVSLDGLLADCLALLTPEIEARDAKVRAGPLPVVSANAALVSGVFANLLINALKYSPRRGGEIDIRAEREAAAWRISVASEGPPIPADDRERIFRPYERGRDERRARGAGLGLAICRRTVARHGGIIGVTPIPGRGNRFFFTLPADAEAE